MSGIPIMGGHVSRRLTKSAIDPLPEDKALRDFLKNSGVKYIVLHRKQPAPFKLRWRQLRRRFKLAHRVDDGVVFKAY